MRRRRDWKRGEVLLAVCKWANWHAKFKQKPRVVDERGKP